MNVRLVAISAGLIALAACAAPRPLVDTRGVDPAKFEQDMRECQAYAEQSYGPGTGAAAGAIAGAILGELLARTGGGMRQRGQLAGAGAVLGGASGAGAGVQEQRQIVSRCLAGRGYNVLN
jgi:hypothetical protein